MIIEDVTQSGTPQDMLHNILDQSRKDAETLIKEIDRIQSQNLIDKFDLEIGKTYRGSFLVITHNQETVSIGTEHFAEENSIISGLDKVLETVKALK